MQAAPIGTQLREWRARRRLSQMDLALDADISTRHLSFIETGRANPSPDMVRRLADRLDVPHRARNALLLAAGYAPNYQERPLDSPEMAGVRTVVDHILKGHEPYPAIAVDRHWNMVSHNAAAVPFFSLGIAPELLAPPVNVLRVSLHPQGLAPFIVNLAQWREHLLERVQHQVTISADATLAALLAELAAYPAPPAGEAHAPIAANAIVVPLVLDTPMGRLSLISTMTVFGTPMEVTLSELALETFFPADAQTAAVLRGLAEAASAAP